MALHIHVFCRSTRPLSYRELAEQMGFMGFLDERPTFVPPLDSPEAQEPNWKVLSLHFKPDKRPVQVERWTEPDEFGPVLDEVYEEMKRAGSWERQQELVKRLRATKQAYSFEMGSDLPEDVWEMLDATEAFLGQELDGVVHSAEGLYDAQLQPLCLWNQK